VKLAKHLYEVILPGTLKVRTGALLRVQWDPSDVGYADLMSWPELGDFSLEDELRLISEKNPSCLGQRVLALSRSDAKARAQMRSLWAGVGEIPTGHVFFGNIEDLQNQDVNAYSKSVVLKLKCSGEFDLELLRRVPHRVRLDWNEKGEASFFKHLFSDEELLQKIDFIEDPFPAEDERSWESLRRDFPNLDIFGDFALQRNACLLKYCSGVVFKPASRDPEVLLKYVRSQEMRLCITQSLGHPLGHAVASLVAAENPDCTTGLNPHSRLVVPGFLEETRASGFGFGWDSAEFEALSWTQL
jgi:hypothetical protein